MENLRYLGTNKKCNTADPDVIINVELLKYGTTAVSYTHLDVYKRQGNDLWKWSKVLFSAVTV